MSGRPLRTLLTLSIFILAIQAKTEQRTQHRLIGGHLRLPHDSQDSELLTASATGSKDKKSRKSDDEDKKTLSQQVADGKYGLIQTELFSKPLKRPGVLSYSTNSEVPTDTINNLGGLTKNDIWLAENHLLVVKGGTYPANKDQEHEWPPIDDYKAPLRQVKIPANPKVPPPFPVQLTDDGPLQILGTNATRSLNGTLEFAVPPPEGYEPGTGPYFPPIYSNSADSPSGQTALANPKQTSGEYKQGAPLPPYETLNGTLPPYFGSLPPGVAILPPPQLPPLQNLNEQFDEDDPSIYYPPPYSFYYPKDNSSKVPPGPLVPGIILPPPPNFFGALDEPKTKKTNRFRTTTTTAHPTLQGTTTPQPPTPIVVAKKPIRLPVPAEINNELNSITSTRPPAQRLVTIGPSVRGTTLKQKIPRPSVTILKPVKTTQAPVYVYNKAPPQKPFQVYGPPRAKTVVSTTQVPLKVYYSTAEIETNSITQSPNRATTKNPSQYYYYEEKKEGTTRKPNYFDIPKEYYVQAKPATQPPPPQVNPQFVYVTSRPRYRFVQQQTPPPPKTDSFSIHIARLQKQIQQFYTTPRPIFQQQRHSPKPVYQFSFEAANYHRPQNYHQVEQQQDKFRPLPKYSVQIQPAIEILPTQTPNYQSTPPPLYYQQQQQQQRQVYSSTEKPRQVDYEYEQVGRNKPTSRPITQFVYEATPNPIYQGYYTKPDEGYFDENTKQYFTAFGKKIPSGTTPLPTVVKAPELVRQQPQKPISLQSDTNVNYLKPRPAHNPNAEFIQVQNPERQRVNYPQVVNYSQQQYVQKQKQEQHQEEITKANQNSEERPGSYISYELPGDDGAHFYFLTPQLAQSRDQGAGYYYSQPADNLPRLRRQNVER